MVGVTSKDTKEESQEFENLGRRGRRRPAEAWPNGWSDKNICQQQVKSKMDGRWSKTGR